MNDAVVSTLQRRTGGALSAVSLSSDVRFAARTFPDERVFPSVSIRVGRTFGNVPTLFSTPLFWTWLGGESSVRPLTPREQLVVHRAIARTARVISKGRLGTP